MPTIKYTGSREFSDKLDLGYGRALVCKSGKAVKIDSAAARAVAAVVADNPDWVITGTGAKKEELSHA